MSDASSCMSSLFKISNKIENILRSFGYENTQRQPKKVSAGTKTFEDLKHENCRWDISETCPVREPT